MRAPGARIAFFAALVAVAPSSVARAWTDATVRSVSAHVVIAPDARADVTLIAELRVAGGWLEGFEMDGLDADLELSTERPPVFEDATGARFAPRVEHRGDGRVVFVFRRRDAPRRGDYVATIAYRTRVSTELRPDGRVRAHWTLPGWRFGLDDVSITVDAPEGAEIVAVEGDEASVTSTRIDVDQGSRVALRRVHLPRTREWPIAIDVPADRMDASVRLPPPAAPAAPLPPPREAPGFPLGALAMGLALALLALAKIAAVARAERASRIASTALVPLGPRSRAALVVALALAASFANPLSPAALALLAGIAILAVHRKGGAPRAPRLGAFRPATTADVRAARAALRSERVGIAALVDPASVPGAAVLSVIAAAPLVAWAREALPVTLEHAALLSALAGIVLLGGTRRARPCSPLVDLAHLAALAGSARADLADDRSWTMRPVLHADVRSELQEARLRLAPAAMPKGLLRLDVVRAVRPSGTSWSAELALLVVAREGSPTDRALEERFPGTKIAEAPRRVARQLPITTDLAKTLAPVLEALATCPIEPSATRASTNAADDATELAATA